MQIQYIAHSGFWVDVYGTYMLFDYYYGELPVLPEGSRLYVFVSHRHADHFNPEIFGLAEKYDVTYILSYDIKWNAYKKQKYGITEEISEHIVSVRYDEDKQIGDLRVRAFQSTDEGVAFLVSAGEKNIYHAGDHNWWHWMGESKQYNHNMAANYKRGISQLIQAEKHIDVAFVPLDSRLGESYGYGMRYFLENVCADHVFPMHFGKDFICRDRFAEEYHDMDAAQRLLKIAYEGETWSFE